MTRRVRCPSQSCASLFEVPTARLGRSMHCPDCGVRMTARPLDVQEQLRAQQQRIAGGEGLPIERLPLAVMVDNVRSLWNVGSVFRTADACGVSLVMLTGITGCPPRSEISKTALGAERAVPWRYRADPHQALQQLRAGGYTPVALETTPRAVSLAAMEWPGRTCLVIGNEVAGVSPDVLEACDLHVDIPMHGVKSSLNVAVAFGIAAYGAAAALSRGAPCVHE